MKRTGFLLNHMGLRIISLLIAVVLWVVVLGSRSIEVVKEVPLEVITSNEVVPANDIPDRIAFRVSGPKAFLRNILDRKEDPIQINLAGSKPGQVVHRVFSDSIRLPLGVKVLSITPQSIPIRLEEVKTKTVPLRVDLRGRMAQGYSIIQTETRPATVQIRGAKSRISAVYELVASPIDLSELKESALIPLTFNLKNYGFQIEGQNPQLWIEIKNQLSNFKIRKVPLFAVGLKEGHVQMSPSDVTVFLRATSTDLEKLTPEMVRAEVSLTGVLPGVYRKKVEVKLPPFVEWVKTLPVEVEVTVLK